MVKNKELKGIVFLGLILATILSLKVALGEEKPEPKLLWQRSFKERIKGVSISYDGSRVLVHTETEIKTKQGVPVTKNYLLGKDGRIERVFEERRPSDAWVLSADGKEIIDNYGGVFDENNKMIRKMDLPIPLRVTQFYYPVFSPSRRYVAIQGATEAEGVPYIGMYDLKTGNLLWEYNPYDTFEPDTWGGFRIKFVDDERLAVYEGRKVWMLKVKTGEKIWETEIFKGVKAEIAYDVGLHMVVNDSGDIVITKIQGYVVSVNRDGQVRWEKMLRRGYGGYAGTTTLSNSGRFLAIQYSPSIEYPPRLALLDNLTGEIVRQKEIEPRSGTNEARGYFTSDDKYLFRCGETLREDNIEGFLYLFDVETGEVVWRWKPEDSGVGFIQVSGDKKRLLVPSGKTVYLFDISNLNGGEE